MVKKIIRVYLFAAVLAVPFAMGFSVKDVSDGTRDIVATTIFWVAVGPAFAVWLNNKVFKWAQKTNSNKK